MEEPTKPQTALPRPPEELHWGIVYLREDIQDIRGEIRGVHARIDQSNQHLDEVAQDIRSEMNAGFQQVHARIDNTAQEIRSEMHSQFHQVYTRIDRLDDKYELLIKRMDNRFLWTITTMIVLSGMVVTILKM